MSDDAKRPSSRQGKSPPDSAAGSDTPRSNQDTHNSPRATKTPGEISRNFGRYRIIRRLGKGGMGTVFLAEDTQLHREVALKIPHFESDDNQELLERFYREARAAATLNHPNLCPIHDVGEIDGVHYLTMAYIEGQSLSDLVRPGAPLAAENAVAIVHNLALGMAEAHEKGIVHRDLKPSNISMNQRGEPVVMDFGLARRKKSGDARLTKSGAVIGTPAYMPPEQIKGDFDAIGPACDIYSLGVILYELLTGEIPFDGPIAAVLGQVLTQEPPPPSKFRADLDPRLEAVCLKMMAKDISDRHPSMADVARDLALSPQAALEVQPRKAPTPGKRKESAQTKTDSKSTQHTHELDKRKKQIESLLKQCEYAPAIDLLEKMAAIKSPKLAKYSLWAQQQLPKAKRGPEEMRESSAAMQRTAADLYDRHDYEQAAEILQQVPKKYRSPEAKKLLRECLDLQEEIVVLQEDIEQAEAINRFDDLLPTVRRLLEIKPNDRRAKRLLKELKTYGKGGNMRLGGRRDQRFDAVGSTFSPTKAVLFVVIPLLLFGAVSWATVVYIRSNNQTNPTAKNPVDDSGDVSIVVADGSTTGTQPPGVKDPEYTTTPQGALKIHIDYPAAWRAGDSRPIVVLFHGGGWRAGSPENLKELAEFFVKLGMVTARPEYRIKQRHGTTPDKCVEDAKTAIRWIRSKYRDLGIDPQRIVAFGTSAGGHLAACTGTAIGGTKAERPNALILLAPHLNLAANVASIEKLGIDRQTANAISPSLHVDSNTPPTLIIHGSDDIIVKLPELQEFATKGNQLDVSVELLTILGARHGLGQLWTDTSQRRITAFLNSRFPPDNRPSDSGQTNKATPVEITNSIGMKLRLISAGEFQMGSPNSDRAANREKEQPRHLVKITKSFYMDIHEVTVGQFRRFVQAEKYRTEAERDGNGAWGYDATRRNLQGKPQYNWKNVGWQQQDNHPVVNVTWNDASAFCRWLSRKEGTTYRLPTEAEWEYSCRAGTSSPYSSGDDVASLQSIANIADSSFSQKIPSRPKSPQSWDDGYPFTAPVGSFQRNDWGLYDMHGNVREWCQDWYAPYGSKKVLSDPAGPAQGQSFADGPHHVLRGGAFGDQPGYVRSADRATYPPGVRILDIGFRVARSIDPAKRTTSQTPRFDPTQPPPAVAPFRDTDTTVELFNGHDLTGWSVGYLRYTKDKSPKRWVIDKTAEVLHSVGGDQDHLITDDQFENYTLDLEWRFTRGYKSGPNGTGVIVHSPGTSNELDPDGFEVDVRFAEISALIETRSKIMKSGGQGMMGTGCFLAYGESITNHSGSANGLIGKENRRHLDWLEPPKIASIYSWNRLSITAVGDQLLVRINGKLVNKAWNLSRHKGRICLRSQNAAVEFRNITLRQHSN